MRRDGRITRIPESERQREKPRFGNGPWTTTATNISRTTADPAKSLAALVDVAPKATTPRKLTATKTGITPRSVESLLLHLPRGHHPRRRPGAPGGQLASQHQVRNHLGRQSERETLRPKNRPLPSPTPGFAPHWVNLPVRRRVTLVDFHLWQGFLVELSATCET